MDVFGVYMTQDNFNIIYHSVCLSIRNIDSQLLRIHKEKKFCPYRRKLKLEKLEFQLLTEELPALKLKAFRLRQNNYSLFLQYQ